jgi:hypothetical protein
MKKDKDEKVINLDELKGKLKPPYHTDSVIYPDGRTSDRDDDETFFPEEDFWNEEQVADVTDQLLLSLNNLVSEHNLTGADILAVLSRLTAAHIHSIQELVNGPEEKDAVESLFQKILQHDLAIFDIQDVQQEMEKIKRERMN